MTKKIRKTRWTDKNSICWSTIFHTISFFQEHFVSFYFSIKNNKKNFNQEMYKTVKNFEGKKKTNNNYKFFFFSAIYISSFLLTLLTCFYPPIFLFFLFFSSIILLAFFRPCPEKKVYLIRVVTPEGKIAPQQASTFFGSSQIKS